MRNHIIVICLLAIAGCTTVKRFKTAKTDATDTVKYVSMDLFSIRSEEKKEEKTSEKTLWDLDAEGQAMLIDKIDKRQTANSAFTEGLNSKYFEDGNKLAAVDYCVKNVKVILSINKLRNYAAFPKSFTPADRIEYLKFKLKLKSGQNAEFIKWDKFQTEFATIDIADVTFARTLEASLTGKAGVNGKGTVSAGETVSAEAGAEMSVEGNIKGNISKTEAQKIKYRYASLNGKLDKDYLQIEEEGTREIDLNGNVVIDATIKFKPWYGKFAILEDLKDKSGAYNPKDKVALKFKPYTMPEFSFEKNLLVDLEYEYVYRFVKGGYKTFPEYDDRICYKTGNGSSLGLNLILADDIKPGIWVITFVDPTTKVEGVLKVKDKFNTISELQFPSYESAGLFRSWLLGFPCADTCLTQDIVISDLILLDGSLNALKRESLTTANTSWKRWPLK